MPGSKPTLYCAWFCPFAQRAWIGLLYKGVDFQYVEQDPYEKTAEWLAINPRGLVPAIIHHNKVVYDSSVCLEYTDEAWPEGKQLMPRDPYTRAHVRLWVDHVNTKMVRPYYAFLIKTGAEREQARQDLLEGLVEFTENMSKDGPFFLGKDFGVVDIAWFPWALRTILALKRYRDFAVPDDGQFTRYHEWYSAVKVVPAVVGTLQDEEKLIQSYQRYAENTAKTLVADAIREEKAMP